MPLYWAADTDGARYCIRAVGMLEAVGVFREHVGEDPEGIDLAADDDVELIGFDQRVEAPPVNKTPLTALSQP